MLVQDVCYFCLFHGILFFKIKTAIKINMTMHVAIIFFITMNDTQESRFPENCLK
jgi:hypothetical protein